MRLHYGITTSSDTYSGGTMINIQPNKRQHTFWLFDEAVYVDIFESELLSLANIVAMVNVLGLPYWQQLQQQVTYDDIPFVLSSAINENVAQWTRDLKLNTVVEKCRIN